MAKSLKLMLLKYFRINYTVTNSFTKKLLLMKLFKIKCFLVNALKKIYQLCLITHNMIMHNLDEGLA